MRIPVKTPKKLKKSPKLNGFSSENEKIPLTLTQLNNRFRDFSSVALDEDHTPIDRESSEEANTIFADAIEIYNNLLNGKDFDFDNVRYILTEDNQFRKVTDDPETAPFEIWTGVPGFDDHIISSWGRVKRVKSGRAHPKGTLIGVATSSFVTLSLSVATRWLVSMRCPVAELMLVSFGYPKPSPLHAAGFKDGNLRNYHLDNLTWSEGTELKQLKRKARKDRRGAKPANRLPIFVDIVRAVLARLRKFGQESEPTKLYFNYTDVQKLVNYKWPFYKIKTSMENLVGMGVLVDARIYMKESVKLDRRAIYYCLNPKYSTTELWEIISGFNWLFLQDFGFTDEYIDTRPNDYLDSSSSALFERNQQAAKRAAFKKELLGEEEMDLEIIPETDYSDVEEEDEE